MDKWKKNHLNFLFTSSYCHSYHKIIFLTYLYKPLLDRSFFLLCCPNISIYSNMFENNQNFWTVAGQFYMVPYIFIFRCCHEKFKTPLRSSMPYGWEFGLEGGRIRVIIWAFGKWTRKCLQFLAKFCFLGANRSPSTLHFLSFRRMIV